jgi:hypothetical protein
MLSERLDGQANLLANDDEILVTLVSAVRA